ncbi:MAG: hypothetical protein L3J20_12615 [Flavobacteriaceae bacterium]|nr:hypothetical protein [Flavobacteriaceae bacterium]
MKNLENYGVQALDAREIKNTFGGGRLAKLVGWVYGTIARYYPRGGHVQSQYGIS